MFAAFLITVCGTIILYPLYPKHFRINRGEIEAEFQRQVKKLQNIKADTLKQEDLKTQMENFLQVRYTFVGIIILFVQMLEAI